ncbi:hypothetical protein J6590_068765 [Homalodisca vitripennis]|nr:hypothetical protein J6590_068765 [Homalodisca vitripennis]
MSEVCEGDEVSNRVPDVLRRHRRSEELVFPLHNVRHTGPIKRVDLVHYLVARRKQILPSTVPCDLTNLVRFCAFATHEWQNVNNFPDTALCFTYTIGISLFMRML